MATTTTISGFAAAPAARKVALPNIAKRFVNALVASRMRAAEAELRRLDLLVRETALTHGEYRKIGLDKADLIPFKL
jgi:hypothetical protein